MADEPIAELGGLTPLQYARTPAMDAIAGAGRNGTLLTLPEGFPTSSEVANMSVLGCDLSREYTGRGPIEAAGRGILLRPDEVAFRVNLTTQRDGILTDFSGGHPPGEEAAALIAALDQAFGGEGIRFRPGVSYRNLLILQGPRFSTEVRCEKPDDNQGERITEHLPVAKSSAGEATAAFFKRLIDEAPAILEAHPVNRARHERGEAMANGVWPWSGGGAGALRTVSAKYGITGAVITAVDVIKGLGRLLGMDVVDVPGATGYIDTNYEGKAVAAIEAIKTHDLVYLHIEGTDEVSHEQNLQLKIKAIEDFDRRIIGPVLEHVGPAINAAVLPDHPVPIALGKHTRTPVPVAVRMMGMAPDGVTCYDEVACRRGALGALVNGDFMALLFGKPR